ncbi:MAG: biotin transporter BioY [Armatimonadetes bacterium]|nr:biotin transporter BioY [Armatimonadota bacterium]
MSLTLTQKPRTLADTLALPSWLLVPAASLVIAACAQVSIPLPFTPVPLTGQTFAVLLTGMALGSRRGALAVALYVLEGGLGLPFFAGGAAGLAKLIGPTGGYLFAFPLAAFLAGTLAERGWDRKPLTTALGMLLASLTIFLFGALWLAQFVGGIVPAVVQGVLPFLPGDVLKSLLAAGLLPVSWRFICTAQHRVSQAPATDSSTRTAQREES